MYDLMAMSPGESAEIVTAIAAVAVLLGSLHSRILSYVLRIQDAISEVKADIVEVKGRTKAIEEAVKEVKERLCSGGL